MEIIKNKSLKNFNTFGIDANAEFFIPIKKKNDLFDVLEKEKNQPIKILGGGSNLLITQDISECLIKNEIKGIQVILENENEVLVRVGGGEIWHELVLWAVANNYGGIENLALIPGTVGAAPIQNIGAYGVELKNVCEGVEFIHLEEKKEYAFSNDECHFFYRDSIFKHELKGKICITHVFFRLSKAPHSLNLTYGVIKGHLEKKGIKNPTIKNICDTVIEIRNSKLPDPKELGNSGSFFKNPELSKEEFLSIKKKFPDIVSYALPSKKYKIPAAWLIEQCGFKGVRYGNTGCYKYQPLVLVNYGNATGKEIQLFSEKIKKAVRKKFGIFIQAEVNIW